MYVDTDLVRHIGYVLVHLAMNSQNALTTLKGM